MKSILVALAMVLTASIGYARSTATNNNQWNGGVAGEDKLDGCGLGWQVTDQRTMIATTTRGTTNAVIPASFGMTSGTLGCEQIKFASNDKESATYVFNNFQNLKSELAEGQGEYVSGMVQSVGCSASQVPSISSDLKKNYGTVVAPAQDAAQLFQNLKSEIHCG